MERKIDKIKAIRVWSANFPGILMTPEAYTVIRSEMVPVDLYTHNHQIEMVDNFDNIITTQELYHVEMMFAPMIENKVEYINNVIRVDFVKKVRIS